MLLPAQLGRGGSDGACCRQTVPAQLGKGRCLQCMLLADHQSFLSVSRVLEVPLMVQMITVSWTNMQVSIAALRLSARQ